MRLGVDGRVLHGMRSGVGNWTWHLLQELPVLIPSLELYLYMAEGLECDVPSRVETFSLRHTPPLPLMSGHFWLKYRAGHLIREDALDVFWAPRTLYPKSLEKRLPVVSTIHDLNSELFPRTMRSSNLLAHKLWFKRDLRNATRVVSNSIGTARRMKSLIGRGADAIVLPGVDIRYRPQSDMQIKNVKHCYSLDRPFMLFVGTLEPRKNLEQLLIAHRQVNATREKPLLLLLAGQRGWRNRTLARQLDAGISQVRELGYVPEDDLPGLYSAAEALIMPSLYEGYGMPAAEAIACGTRVVATDIPELREAAGPEAVYVKPTAEAIAAGIVEALQQPSPEPRPGHSWSVSASILANILRDAADSAQVARMR